MGFSTHSAIKLKLHPGSTFLLRLAWSYSFRTARKPKELRIVIHDITYRLAWYVVVLVDLPLGCPP